MKTMTKATINKGLESIYKKYCNDGIRSNDCTTELEELFYKFAVDKNN